jgi:predicted nucleotidyltransferase
MSGQVAAILADLRRRLENRYGARLVGLVLYGSRARGDADAASDIDVLVVLKGPVSPGEEIGRTVEDVSDVSLRYDETVVCVFVSEEEYQGRKSPLMLNVRREGVPA